MIGWREEYLLVDSPSNIDSNYRTLRGDETLISSWLWNCMKPNLSNSWFLTTANVWDHVLQLYSGSHNFITSMM